MRLAMDAQEKPNLLAHNTMGASSILELDSTEERMQKQDKKQM